MKKNTAASNNVDTRLYETRVFVLEAKPSKPKKNWVVWDVFTSWDKAEEEAARLRNVADYQTYIHGYTLK